jgi:hypothetical protein
MTVAAAVAFTAWHFASRRRGGCSRAVFTTMLMFWGAALMWSVDCVANALDGEPLLDISREDFVLGLIVWAAGLAVFGLLSLIDRKRAAPRCAGY